MEAPVPLHAVYRISVTIEEYRHLKATWAGPPDSMIMFSSPYIGPVIQQQNFRFEREWMDFGVTVTYSTNCKTDEKRNTHVAAILKKVTDRIQACLNLKKS